MFNRLERILVACNRWVLILLLLVMACIVFANVVLRYTTGDSIVWAEEVARHLMIWGTFLGAGLVLRLGAMWPSTTCIRWSAPRWRGCCAPWWWWAWPCSVR